MGPSIKDVGNLEGGGRRGQNSLNFDEGQKVKIADMGGGSKIVNKCRRLL